MDGKRSYLDTLNDGRQRRAATTLDELSRSLELLGERLERRDGDAARGGPAQDHRRPGWSSAEEALPAMNRLPSWREDKHLRGDDPYQAVTGRLATEV